MKKLAKIYTMSRDGWTDHFEMHVSKTVKQMREHIKSIYRKLKHPIFFDINQVLGVVSPVRSNSDANGELFCYLFLNEENLGVGIVGHEVLHVAMAHERFVNRFGMAYGPEIGDDEERLCYFYTDCIKGVYNTLRENGHIKE